MKKISLHIFGMMILALLTLTLPAVAQQGGKEVSFTRDVFPVVRKYCLPCHEEESFNRSELSLDSHELLMKGGKHGPAVIPGKPEESLVLKKLSDAPPFGDQMPPARRKRSGEGAKRLTPEELRILSDWIAQGARKN
jgi:hypothetical protein